jgi:hypothetical protein
MANPIPGGEGLVIGLKRFGALNAQGLAELNALLASSPGRSDWNQFVKSKSGTELMGLLRESVDEETVNYLAEDPTLLRLLPVAVGEIGAHAADIGTAGVGLYRLGRAGVQAGMRRFNPSLADQFAPGLRQVEGRSPIPLEEMTPEQIEVYNRLYPREFLDEALGAHVKTPDELIEEGVSEFGLRGRRQKNVLEFKKKEPQSVADIFEGRDDVNPMELYDELLRRKQAYEESIDAISGEGKEIEKKILKRSNFPDEANRLSGLHSSKTDEFVEVSNEYEKILRYIQRMEDEWGPGLEDLLPPVPTGPRRID